MNADHLELCASEGWREVLRDLILPHALADTRLGDDVLEVGPGPGMTTDLLRVGLVRLTTVEVARVLRPGGVFVASDSVELATLHVDDIYNPVDPATLEARVRGAGFATVDVRSNELGWAAHAATPV